MGDQSTVVVLPANLSDDAWSWRVQVLSEKGVPEEQVAQEIRSRVPHFAALRAADQGVASVLLASAQVRSHLLINPLPSCFGFLTDGDIVSDSANRLACTLLEGGISMSPKYMKTTIRSCMTAESSSCTASCSFLWFSTGGGGTAEGRATNSQRPGLP